jgi:hypothetical protein
MNFSAFHESEGLRKVTGFQIPAATREGEFGLIWSKTVGLNPFFINWKAIIVPEIPCPNTAIFMLLLINR